MKIKSAIAGALLLAPSLASAQSSPGLSYGQVPTAGQWNSYFASKQDALGYRPVNRAGDTMLGKLNIFPSAASAAGLNVASGLDPSSPINGDVWVTLTGFYTRVAGVTYNLSLGPIAPSRLPAPTATTLGGVKSYISPANQFLTGIDTTGAPTSSQPTFANIASVASCTQVSALTGDVVTVGCAATIQPASVTYAKFQNIAAASLFGNPTGSSASGQAISLGATLAFTGTALQTIAHTGDCTTPANSFAITCTKISGVSISLAGAFSTAGAYPIAFTASAATSLVLPTSGTLATVGGALGAATATSINGLAIGTTSGATFALATGKSFTVSNGLTLAGTDGTTFTFPGASDIVVGAAAAQTLTNKTFASPVLSGAVSGANTIPNGVLVNSTISGTALGGTLPTLTFGSHLTGTGYNGTGAVTLGTDAASANTSNALVARDASGNFSAGAITAALTGHASSDLALAGGTMSGPIAMGGNAVSGASAVTAAAITDTGLLTQGAVCNSAAGLLSTSGAGCPGVVQSVTTGGTGATTSTGTGSTVLSISPALTGAPTTPTAAVDTNTTQIASMAAVLGQASSVAPSMNGTAAIGTSTRYMRADAVAPTDTTRAPASRTITAGSGMTGGGDLTADRTVGLATNGTANGNLAQAGAATLKGNPTASTANVQDFTVQGLTNSTTPSASADYLPIYDSTSGTLKKVTPNVLASVATAGVSTLNGASGGVTIAPGTGTTVGTVGSTITIGHPTGAVIQSVSASYSTETSGAANFTSQATPTTSNGTQILSASITPGSSSSKVRARVTIPTVSASAASAVFVAMFRGSTFLKGAVPLAPANAPISVAIELDDSPATTIATTYSVRFGTNTGGTTPVVNQYAGSFTYMLGTGGIASQLTLEELSP